MIKFLFGGGIMPNHRMYTIALALLAVCTFFLVPSAHAKHIRATIDKNGIMLDYELSRRIADSVQINEKTPPAIIKYFGISLSVRVLV
jgi:hypothetical protein